jgi:hypothetical protein
METDESLFGTRCVVCVSGFRSPVESTGLPVPHSDAAAGRLVVQVPGAARYGPLGARPPPVASLAT